MPLRAVSVTSNDFDSGVILLDLPASSFTTVCEQVANAMTTHGMDSANTKRIMNILQMKHTLVFRIKIPLEAIA